jgi:ABC-type multidrug transport system ATPase subunit
MSEPILTYNGIYLNYGDNLVIRNLSGALKSGKLYLLSGDNGSGKTSLLRILSGNIKPKRGTISGEAFNSSCIKALIGISGLYSYLSVVENLALFAKGAEKGILESYRLEQYQNVLVKELSQGCLQRLSLGILLSSSANLIFIDEPTNFLDVNGKSILLEKLKSILQEGKAVMLSSHEPELFSDLDPVSLILKNGDYV